MGSSGPPPRIATDDGASLAALPQLGQRHRTKDIVCDVIPAQEYSLIFSNQSDVICLVLGSLETTTSYDGGRARPIRFGALTMAWHPAGGQVAVKGHDVRGGFVAFTYPDGYHDRMLGDRRRPEITYSVDNLSSPAVANLVSYAEATVAGPGTVDPMALEWLAGLAYVETLRSLGTLSEHKPPRMVSNRDISRAIDYIEEQIGSDLSHAELAGLVGVPVATLARSFKLATGQSLHQFVLARRIAQARRMMEAADANLADIAYACGFASQQHMTTVFSRHLGTTPARYRAQVGTKGAD
jgi:AraC family transcriptional regulator